MNTPVIEWKKPTHQFATGEIAYLGRWNVGGYHWNSVRRDGDDWVVSCKLPGIKDTLGSFATKVDARARLEIAVTFWFDNLDKADG